MDTLALLVHPVRLRLMHAMSGEQALTTTELCARLPDVSKASVYRHVSRLADSGILRVDGETRVRGAVERRYRLDPERVPLGAEGAADDRDELRRWFGVAMTVLMAEFDAFVSRDCHDPIADQVSFRQHELWLSPVERAELVSALRAVIGPRLGHRPAPGRSRHLVSPILFPTAQTPPPDPSA